MSVCKECNKPIALNALAVYCKGFCDDVKHYHADCVGLSYDKAVACLHANIMWMCDPCRELLQNIKFRNIAKDLQPTEDRHDEIDQLKQDISRINETLAKLVSPTKNDSIPSCEATNSGTENRDASDILLSSTRMPGNIIDESSRECTKLSLFVSNIAPDVTDVEVENLVRRSLNTPESVPVRRLVPSWKNQSSMQYVSFKVDVDRKYRDIALDSTTWPRAVRCREFKYFSEASWRPAYNVNHPERTV